MTCEAIDISGPVLVKAPVHGDDRGCFLESFNAARFEEQTGLSLTFIQDNISYSEQTHTLRGLHLQTSPFAQGKFVQCVQGQILDVFVDARPGSDTLGQWGSVMLDALDGRALWIPEGFLHGFLTLKPHTIVTYKVTAPYDRDSDVSVLWNDPDIGIDWGQDIDPVLSDKDRNGISFNAYLKAQA